MKHNAVRWVLALMTTLALAGLAGTAPRAVQAGSGTASDYDTGAAPQTLWLACSSTCVDPDGG